MPAPRPSRSNQSRKPGSRPNPRSGPGGSGPGGSGPRRSGPGRGGSKTARAYSGGSSERDVRDDVPPTLASITPDRYRTIGGGVRIVHEDSDLLVVDKPAGLLTSSTPKPGHTIKEGDSVFELVKEYARQKSKRRGVRAWIIHRLDKEASGLLVFAKSEQAFMALKEEFKTKRAHRLYAAVVEGTFAAPLSPGRARPGEPISGSIHNYLYEDERGLVHITDSPTPILPSRPRDQQGEMDPSVPRFAVTHFQVQEQQHTGDALGRALLHVRLETGRKHQIRVHLKSLNKPIVGDRRYGAATDPLGRLCLHAIELGFAHPRTGETVRFRSPIPGTFLVLVGAKRDDLGSTDSQRNMPPTRNEAYQSPREIEAALIISSGSSGASAASAWSSATDRETDDTDESNEPVAIASPQPASSELASRELASRDEARPARTSPRDAGWDHVASWYDKLIDERGSDHHEQTILPGALRLLGAPLKKGSRVLDLACGQGVLCRRLAMSDPPVSCVGVDASPGLIEHAGKDDPRSTYLVGDARALPELAELHRDLRKPFDAVCCLMAMMNIEPLSPVCKGISQVLKPGGAFVAVMLHPAFRSMGQTGWVWDIPEEKESIKDKGKRKGKRSERMEKPFVGRQYRRVDGYLTSYPREIVMNPGKAAHGREAVTTTTYHRPIQYYVRMLFEAGLMLTHLEEWPSLRQSQPGPRAQEENRARREIPMFLAIRAVKP